MSKQKIRRVKEKDRNRKRGIAERKKEIKLKLSTSIFSGAKSKQVIYNKASEIRNLFPESPTKCGEVFALLEKTLTPRKKEALNRSRNHLKVKKKIWQKKR